VSSAARAPLFLVTATTTSGTAESTDGSFARIEHMIHRRSFSRVLNQSHSGFA
jgi:hypothetical protein